ncbi:MAG: Gfo/Idh/MocA family oxidoreductase [Anaerolineales bacterium]|jgi:predicted dehydrogenase
MAIGKELRSRAFNLDSRFSYLAVEDRYLFAKEDPKYKFNVIGCGLNGNEHIFVTMLEGRATIQGVFDENPGSVALAKNNLARFDPDHELVCYETLEAACNDPAVDALIITTPNYTHLEVLKIAAQSGKHIFLEKPMATTIEDAQAILEIARDYPAILQIGLQYRYKAIYVEAIHEAFERQSLGEIKMINIIEHRLPFLDKVKQWNKFSKFSGGTLVEKCCHYFDLLNMFSRSKPVSVFATGTMAVNFREFEYNSEKCDILDNAIVSVEYANGVRGSFNLCMFAPMFYEEITLCGDEGYLKAYEKEDFLPPPRPKTYLEVLRGETQPSRICNPCYPPHIEDSGHNGATFYEHVNFINNLEGKPNNTATVDEGFWSVVIGAAAEESVKTGKVVLIDELLQKSGVK